MRNLVLLSALVAAGMLAGCAGELVAGDAAGASADVLARQVLPANDGWAAFGGGVTGGAAATADHVYTVSTRKELVAALSRSGDSAKIIQIKGTINLSTDDEGNELVEKDYAVAPYNFDAYVRAYAPATWNRKLVKGKPDRELGGEQEAAREASVKRQRAQIEIHLPSNTTLIGLGADAKIVKGDIFIGKGVENVIIRNIAFEDAFDYFPQWDPADSFKIDKSYPGCQESFADEATGPQKCPGGRWNSEYDSISISGGKRVWIDHCSFSDGERNDKKFPPNFPFPHNEVTQKIQHHDGAVDVTNGGDLVTLSFNYFKDHDKTNLIGGSDSMTTDRGSLRVTFHHNVYDNIGQRMPRVRFGQVHVYNNLYMGDATASEDAKLNTYDNHLRAIKLKTAANIFRAAIGAGKESSIYSEQNVFEITAGDVKQAVINQGATAFFDQGSLVNGQPADLLKGASGKPMTADVGWKPSLVGTPVLPAAEVAAYVKAHAGPGKL